MDIKTIVRSKSFQGMLVGFFLAIILLVVFQAGMAFGYRKAAFTFQYGDNYYHTFGERGGPRMLMFRAPGRGGDLINANGTMGKVVSAEPPLLIVADPQEVEKVVVVGDETLVRGFTGDIQATDIKVDDFIAVFGTPNDESQIEARLIRILPPPPEQGQPMMRMNIRQ